MSSQRFAFRVCAFVATVVLTVASLSAKAGHGGGGYGGGGYYGGYHGGYYGGFHGGYGGYYHGYYGPYRGFYGYYRGYGWGYGGFGMYGYLPYPYYGFGLGIGVGYPGYIPYGVPLGAYYPSTSVLETSPASSLGDPPPGLTAGSPPPAASADPSAAGARQPKSDGTARLMLLVPVNAQVWFDGHLTSQTGTEREFVSPVLTPNKVYTYSVRVRYPKDDGRVSDDTRAIQVRANDRWVVDFTRPAPRMQEEIPEARQSNQNPPLPR
jgi:uncharacterized protein (TIGR03000 family)